MTEKTKELERLQRKFVAIEEENAKLKQTFDDLESAFDSELGLKSVISDTDIFIYPGYHFRCVDALITNFHLPKSTLMMLVSALAGKDFIMNSYSEAVNEEYRFFSFGDAMFIK